MRPMFARSGVGARVGVGEDGATVPAVAVGDAVAGGVVGSGEGDGDAAGGAVGDGLGGGGAVGGGLSGAVVAAGVAEDGVGVRAGAAGAMGTDVEAGRGAAATADTVGVDSVDSAIAAGRSSAGGARVGTVTLGVSATSPLQADISTSTIPRIPKRIATLAGDRDRVMQRRTMVVISRRSLYRASGLG